MAIYDPRARRRRNLILVGERLESAHHSGLLEPPARAEQHAAGGVDPGAGIHCHHRREHRQACRMGGRKVDALAGRIEATFGASG